MNRAIATDATAKIVTATIRIPHSSVACRSAVVGPVRAATVGIVPGNAQAAIGRGPPQPAQNRAPGGLNVAQREQAETLAPAPITLIAAPPHTRRRGYALFDPGSPPHGWTRGCRPSL